MDPTIVGAAAGHDGTGGNGVSDDHALVSRAQAGDTAAFEQLVQRHAAMAYRVAMAVVHNAEDAQDVSQHALLSAWRGLSDFRGEAAFSTWLHQIVHRLALNSVTRDVRANWVPYDIEMADLRRGPAQQAEADDDAAGLHRAVTELPTLQRRALRLRHFEGRSYREISKAIDSSVPAVRSHLYRARKALATALADQR